MRRRIVALAPDDANALGLLAAALLIVVNSDSEHVQSSRNPVLIEVLDTTGKLAKLDPQNSGYVEDHLIAMAFQATALANDGRIDQSAAVAADLVTAAWKQYQSAPEKSEVARNLVAFVVTSAEIALLRNDPSAARRQLASIADLTSQEPKDPSMVRQWLRAALLDWDTAPPERRQKAAATASEWYGRSKHDDNVEAMRYAALSGNRKEAIELLGKLNPSESGNAFTRRFCRDHGLAIRGGKAKGGESGTRQPIASDARSR